MNLRIQLPAALSDYAQSQVAAGRFSSVDEFVIALVQADQVEQQIQSKLDNNPRLEQLLAESLNSGPGRVWTAEVMEEHRQRILARAEAGRDGK